MSLILKSIKAKYYKFMLDGLMFRHYEIVQEQVKILEVENKVQKEYISHLEKELGLP